MVNADEFLGYPNWIPELSVDIYNSIANNFKTINKFGKTQNINKFKRLFGLGEQEIYHIFQISTRLKLWF